MGTNDLAKETFARIVPGRAPMMPWLMNCVAAARAYEVAFIVQPLKLRGATGSSIAPMAIR